MQIKFQGVKRDGSWSWGEAEFGDITRWVEDCFNGGWRELMVFAAGYEVAGIAHDSRSDGQRTWWTEP